MNRAPHVRAISSAPGMVGTVYVTCRTACSLRWRWCTNVCVGLCLIVMSHGITLILHLHPFGCNRDVQLIDGTVGLQKSLPALCPLPRYPPGNSRIMEVCKTQI